MSKNELDKEINIYDKSMIIYKHINIIYYCNFLTYLLDRI